MVVSLSFETMNFKKNQVKKDNKTTFNSSACETARDRPPKCNNLAKTFETIFGRLKLNFDPCRFYFCCLTPKKRPNNQKTCLPSKQDLDERYPAPDTLGIFPTTTTIQRPKIETPYWAVRQRLPKNAVLYEKSKVDVRNPHRELSPVHLIQNNLFASPMEHKNCPTTLKSYETGCGLYRKNSRPKIKIPSTNFKMKHYSPEYRDSISSVDSSYKTVPCSRRTSGYSSAGSEFGTVTVETPSCKLEATPEVIEDVSKQSNNSIFEEHDGYKFLTSKNYSDPFQHEYVNH